MLLLLILIHINSYFSTWSCSCLRLRSQKKKLRQVTKQVFVCLSTSSLWFVVFVDLRTFTFMEGEKMKCKIILPWNEIRGEITEYYFYQTLSMYNFIWLPVSNIIICSKELISNFDSCWKRSTHINNHSWFWVIVSLPIPFCLCFCFIVMSVCAFV